MSKASKSCISCEQDNLSEADFCTNCGTSFPLMGEESTTASNKPMPTKDERDASYRDWVMSLPYLIAACLLLIFIDYITGYGLTWFYWGVVPILLFAIVAPFFSYRLERAASD